MARQTIRHVGDAASLAADHDQTLFTALSLMANGATLSTREGEIVFANQAEEQLFGYEQGELIGRHVSIQNAYSPEENERIVRSVMGELSDHGSWAGEWINRRKDGSVFISSCVIRSVMWRGRQHFLCVRQPSGAPTGEDQDRLRIATEAAALGIWEWDIPSNTFTYSARARAICGFPQTGDVTYEDVVRVTHPADFPTTSAQAAGALDPAVRDRTPFEYRLIRPDGEIRWVRAFGFAVFSTGDEPRALRYIGTLEDITERIAARLAEQEEARQLRLALESARMAVWSLDLQRMTLRPSPEFNLLLGFDADAKPTVGEIEARYAPSTRADLQAHWDQVITSCGQNFEHELQILRDGAERWLRVRCEVSYLPDGAPDRAVGIVMDVTEERRALDAARESDARFKEAADSAPAPVWMTNANGQVEFGNRAMAEFAGMSQDEILGDQWLARIHPDDIGRVAAVRAEAWRNDHSPYTVSARFKRADGSWRWLEVNARARRGADGEFRGYVGLAVDTTEAREAVAALSESETRFRNFADNAPVMVWVTDASGSCTFLSKTWYDFTGQTPETGLGAGWLAAVHPDDAERSEHDFITANASGRPFRLEYRLRHRDGTYVWAIDAASPRIGENGEFLGYIGSVLDISERKRAEEQREALLREVNHRSKNMLSLVQAIARSTALASPGEFLSRFDLRLQALAASQDLLVSTNWSGVNLRSLLRSQLGHFEELLASRIHMSGPDISLQPSAVQPIGMALHELGTNAGKYGALMNEKGSVDIEWRLEDDGQLFTMTWRERGGPLVTPPIRKGFGSTVIDSIVKSALGAMIDIVFDPNGLCWRMQCAAGRALDEVAPASAQKVTPSDPFMPATGRTRTVLVVEDEPLIALNVASTLEDAGYDVLGPAHDVATALHLIEGGACNLAVLDVNLGRETSEAIAKRLVELNVPFLALSGYSRTQQPEVFRSAPALTKPMNPELLLAALALLAQSREFVADNGSG